jgi:hypothetical protein
VDGHLYNSFGSCKSYLVYDSVRGVVGFEYKGNGYNACYLSMRFSRPYFLLYNFDDDTVYSWSYATCSNPSSSSSSSSSSSLSLACPPFP